MIKRFAIGFLVGIGLMHFYLNHGDLVQAEVNRWFQGSASKYRGDAEHEAAREALGEAGRRH